MGRKSYRVMLERSQPKVIYPAFGERPKTRPAIMDPLLVKRPTNP